MIIIIITKLSADKKKNDLGDTTHEEGTSIEIIKTMANKSN